MKNPLTRRAALVAALLSTSVAVAGCSPGSDAGRSAEGGGASAAEADATTTYSTRHLDVPLDLHLPSWLKATPDQDTEHFVTFSGTNPDLAVRLLRPTDVFAPGSTTRQPVPVDYKTYLLGQTHDGARFADRAETRVDGHRASVLTATTDRALDGSIGCQSAATPAHECFGLQPDYLLRLALVETRDGPLLIWLRDASRSPDAAADAQRLASVLAGVRFAARTVQAEPTAPTSLEGDFTALGTHAQARSLGVQDPCPSTAGMRFRLELHEGRFVQREGCRGAASEVGSQGTYRVSGSTLVLYETCCGQSVLDLTKKASGFTLRWHDTPSDPMAVFVFDHTWTPAT